jgi:hypothetical protein
MEYINRNFRNRLLSENREKKEKTRERERERETLPPSLIRSKKLKISSTSFEVWAVWRFFLFLIRFSWLYKALFRGQRALFKVPLLIFLLERKWPFLNYCTCPEKYILQIMHFSLGFGYYNW